MPNPELFCPPDAEAAAAAGACCGHCVLAAALGRTVAETMPFFEKKGWINIPMMETAALRAGALWEKLPHEPPREWVAVCMVEWQGPWTGKRGAFAHRHWMAASGGFLWDANEPDTWLLRSQWERHLLPLLLPPRATGWKMTGIYRVR